jgi:hypothetical protein
MTSLNFTEEDKKKVIQFLNMVAEHGSFDLKTGELIEYFKLLSFMQQTLIPKLDANILEIKRVIEAKEQKQE